MKNMSKVIVNLNGTRRLAFRRGFVKGLGAPVMLFGEHALDSDIADYNFKPLPVRKHGSISGDWFRVGSALKSVAKKQRG